MTTTQPKPFSAFALEEPVAPRHQEKAHPADSSSEPPGQEWLDTFQSLHSGAGESTYAQRAEHLHGYGWRPDDLARVCSNPRELMALADLDDATQEETEAFTALLQEASHYYSLGHTVSLALRTNSAERLAVEFGWGPSRIAVFLGERVSRVRAFLAGQGEAA